jgi:alpha-L-arabinofuranosidase
VVLPLELGGVDPLPSGLQNLYASASHDDATGEIIIKIVNPGEAAQNTQIVLDGVHDVAPTATEIVLAGNPEDVNSMLQPEKISPVLSQLENVGAKFSCVFAPHSMTVLRIKAD